MANTQAPELRQEAFLKEEGAGRTRAAAPAVPQKRKPLVILTTVLVVALIAGAIMWFLTRNYQSTDDAFIDGHITQVSPRVSATVIKLAFDDNQEVNKGDLLLELDPRDFQVALEKAQAQLLEAQAQVQQAQAQEVQAQAQLDQQTAQFNIAKINYNRDASLYQQDFRAVAKEDVDTTQANFNAAQATMAAAQASVKAAEAQVGSGEAAVHAAQAAVDDAALQLSYTEIRAPESGQIAHRTVEAGNYVTAGQTMFSIVQHDVWVTANFKETQLGRMKPGQPVKVRVDSYPRRELNAHIDSIQMGSGPTFGVLPPENATGNYVKVVQRIPVKIVFDESEGILRLLAPGMSVEPRVDVGADGNAQKQ